MKVALLGAPGSGKTKIGRRIVRRLNGDTNWHGGTWRQVDGYVDRLRTRTGHNFGPLCSLQDNLIILGERWAQEEELKQRGHNTLTCGSIYETIIYGAYPSMLIPFIEDEQMMLEATDMAEITMQMLGRLERLTVDYDALLLLPAPNLELHSWDEVVNAKLVDVVLGFNRVPFILDGTDRHKVDYATEVIRIIASTFPTDEQQAVRHGTATGS